MILVSPAEPAVLKAVGPSSPIPEKYGADFFWQTAGGDSVGVQRKEVKDLVNSLHNGLLGKELAKMNQLDLRIMLVEGDFRWTTSGASGSVNGWTKAQQTAIEFSFALQGLWIVRTENKEETILTILSLQKFLDKDNHSLIRNRPKASSSWGKADNKDWAVHLLQSFDGVAANTAERIYDHFEGVPLCWTVTKDELMEVKGVGAKRAETLMTALPNILQVIEGMP